MKSYHTGRKSDPNYFHKGKKVKRCSKNSKRKKCYKKLKLPVLHKSKEGVHSPHMFRNKYQIL